MKMRCARVEPHVQRVFVFHIIIRIRAEEFVDVQSLPRLNPTCLDQLRHTFEQLRCVRVQLSRGFVQEKRHRHAPLALTRQRPIGAIGNHRVQTRLAPRREKPCGFHTFERGLAQGFPIDGFIHTGKPLGGCAENQGGFVSPAVHITVRCVHHFKQRANLSEFFNDDRIGFPNVHPTKKWQIRRIHAVAHHGGQNIVVRHAV